MLETSRLILCRFEDADLDPLAVMYADPEVMRYIGTGEPISREQTRTGLNSAMDHWKRFGFGLWAVQFKADGNMIGFAGLKYLDQSREVEVGYRSQGNTGGSALLRKLRKRRCGMDFNI